MSSLGIYFLNAGYSQCQKELFPDADNLTEVFTKVNNEAFQNCLVRYNDSY